MQRRPGVYAAMAAMASQPPVADSGARQPTAPTTEGPGRDSPQPTAASSAPHPAAVHNGALQPERFLSGERLRWAECTNVAPPRQRNNREEIEAAFNDFKERFYNSPDQLSQDQRPHKKRSRFNCYLKQVFGHHNAIFDYLETGQMPPLNPAVPALPLHERVLEGERSVRRRLT